MDIHRPGQARSKRTRAIVIAGALTLLSVTVTYGLAHLKPADPSIARASILVDTVRVGEMVRQVSGTGTLVPREVRWIATQSDGRVERIAVQAGSAVEADTVLIEMSNAALVKETEEARYASIEAQAEFTAAKLRLRNQQLDQEAALAAARAEYEAARLQVEAENPLAAQGIVPMLQHKRSELQAEQLKIRMQIEEKRLAQFSASVEAQLASKRAHVEQAKQVYERHLEQVNSLQVRAGLAGILQTVSVEPGQRITLGTNVARVARPDGLKAQLRVPETQARDVQPGQRAMVDTRNGSVQGRVTRIDPAVHDGTVRVDVEFTDALPRGARPDLSVDGTIEIELLPRVAFTGRPANSQPGAAVTLFKLIDQGHRAVRVPVQLGRASVSTVEIVRGLSAGDQVILSDTTTLEGHNGVNLN